MSGPRTPHRIPKRRSAGYWTLYEKGIAAVYCPDGGLRFTLLRSEVGELSIGYEAETEGDAGDEVDDAPDTLDLGDPVGVREDADTAEQEDQGGHQDDDGQELRGLDHDGQSGEHGEHDGEADVEERTEVASVVDTVSGEEYTEGHKSEHAESEVSLALPAPNGDEDEQETCESKDLSDVSESLLVDPEVSDCERQHARCDDKEPERGRV